MIRTFHLLQRAFQNESGPNIDVVDIPSEIGALLVHAKEKTKKTTPRKLVALVRFFANEAPPKEFLVSLTNWMQNEKDLSSDLYPILQIILQRGCQEAESVVELSNSLQLVKKARLDTNPSQSNDQNNSATIYLRNGSLWKHMSRGSLPIAK